MCGVVGMVAKSNVNQSIYDALTVLQHRGQDAAGMMTFGDGRFNQRKGNGLVRDVFRQHHMHPLLRFWMSHTAPTLPGAEFWSSLL